MLLVHTNNAAMCLEDNINALAISPCKTTYKTLNMSTQHKYSYVQGSCLKNITCIYNFGVLGIKCWVVLNNIFRLGGSRIHVDLMTKKNKAGKQFSKSNKWTAKTK